MSAKIETLESLEAQKLYNKFESVIDMESRTPYDPRNMDDLKHLTIWCAMECVDRILELENINDVFWVGVKIELENML